MKKILFSEKQFFPRWIAALIIAFTAGILIFSLIMVQKDEPEAISWLIPVYLACLIPVALPFFIGVEVKISEDGVYYRSIPFQRKLRFVSFQEGKIRYGESGLARKLFNYGMKYSAQKSYLLVGKHNLIIEQRKRTIVIGTRKHRELQRVLQNLNNQTTDNHRPDSHSF